MKDAVLWRQILNGGFQCPDDTASVETFCREIIKAPIIVDSRFGGPDRFEHLGDMNECLSMTFPFSTFWLEGEAGDPNEEFRHGRWGAIISTQAKPRVRMYFIAAISRSRTPHMIGCAEFSINDDGDYIKGTLGIACPPTIVSAYDGGNTATRIVFGFCRLACDTLVLLGCKNVGLKPNESDPKEVRRAIKRHGPNPNGYRYHTLVVRPPGAKSDSPGVDIGIMPRHVCRGHFSEYGEKYGKGLLFGKYSGRFFIPPHLKGKKENGIVEKDYIIKPKAVA